MKLSNIIQKYAWGNLGESSIIAQLARQKISSSENYAELWMGTHCSGASKVAATGELLSKHLNDNCNVVGSVPYGYPNNDLPFLFKVLSVGTALSIQAHPDKLLARELHVNFPNIYKDPNHKPEMMIALTPFEALCGFRDLKVVYEQIEKQYNEFVPVIGGETVLKMLRQHVNGSNSISADRNIMKEIFVRYMDCKAEVMRDALEKLIHRLSNTAATASLLDALLLRLHKQYPYDSGIFAPILLNYIQLPPFASFFMGPNIPHAYLSGDCMECMALSDNVVRVGLTPKLKDIPTLCRMLTYSPPQNICQEFEVECMRIPICVGEDSNHNPGPHPIRSLDCGSIVIVIHANSSDIFTLHKIVPKNDESNWQDDDGKTVTYYPTTQSLEFGDVVYIPAQVGYEIGCAAVNNTNSSSNSGMNDGCNPNSFPNDRLILFRAHINCGKESLSMSDELSGISSNVMINNSDSNDNHKSCSSDSANKNDSTTVLPTAISDNNDEELETLLKQLFVALHKEYPQQE